MSVWWWGAWSSTQRRRGRGGGITSNTHRSFLFGQGAGVVHLPRRRRRLPLGRARVLYVERWRTLRDFCVSVWWWGA